MPDICGDNRFEVIAEAKRDLLESTNIEMSPDEMSVIDNILFRCWQMGWLRQYETFEFCTDCKEYDNEKHCCHRWTKVIRQTVEEMRSQQPEQKWIPVTEALPIDGSLVIACSPYDGITIVNFRKGISQEDRTKMKNGEIDDPSEETWCLSEGYSKSKRSDLFKAEDEWGNNQKAYAWEYGPFHYSGQDFVAWMPLPEPYRGE